MFDGKIRKGERRSPATEFKKGLVPWNKGKRMVEYIDGEKLEHIKTTQFKKGSIPPQQKPPGYVSRLMNKGVPEYNINIDWHGNRKPHNSYKWYLWEVEHQQDRPEGHVLAIINGNPDDMRLENFELITRAELARRNKR